jgi:hypothetical protein
VRTLKQDGLVGCLVAEAGGDSDGCCRGADTLGRRPKGAKKLEKNHPFFQMCAHGMSECEISKSHADVVECWKLGGSW